MPIASYVVIGVLAFLVYFFKTKKDTAEAIVNNDAIKAGLTPLQTKIDAATTALTEQAEERATIAATTQQEVSQNDSTQDLVKYFNDPSNSNK